MQRSLLAFCLLTGLLVTNQLIAQIPVDVYVSNRAGDAVHRYDTNGVFLGQFVVQGDGGLDGTEDIVFHPDGSVLVSGFNNTVVKRYDGTTGSFLGDFTSGYTLTTPSKMSIGPDSMLYVTQWGGSQKIVRFDLNGVFVDEWSDIAVPNGLFHIRDSLGVMYIAAYGSGSDGVVMKFDANGNYMGDHINSTVLQGPTTVWALDNGHMLVADWSAGVVQEFDQAGGYIGPFISSIAQPEGMAGLSNGDLLIGDWIQDAVHRFDDNGGSLGLFAQGNGLSDVNSVRLGPHIPTTGVNDPLPGIIELQVYPNMGTGPFRIQADGFDRMELTDAQGRVVQFERAVLPDSETSLHVRSDIANGLYVLKVYNRERLIGLGEIVLQR